MPARSACRIVGSLKDYADVWIKHRNVDRLTHIINTKYLSHNIPSSESHILDIGCGGAFNLTKFHEHFNNITLIEPNPYFQQIWSKHKWINEQQTTIYPYSIEDVIDNKEQINSVDVIISHHSIYHYPLERLNEILLKKMSFLKQKESSLMIISLFVDDGDFINHCFKNINPNYKLSETLETILNSNNIKYEIDYSTVTTAQKGKQNMVEFLQWFVIQYCCNQNWIKSFDFNDKVMMEYIQDTINSFIDNYCKECSVCGGYVYDFDAAVNHYVIKAI